MTDAEYQEAMNVILGALHIAHSIAETVTEEDLRIMAETGRRADTLAFLLVPPMQLPKADHHQTHPCLLYTSPSPRDS